MTLAERLAAHRTPGEWIAEEYHGKYEDPTVPLWLNLGFWETARTYIEACEQLATIVATAARLAPGQRVVDAGAGFAEPARFWARQYGVHVVAVNNDLFQCGVAERRVLASGLSDRITVMFGSATATRLDAGAFDAVVALESAFHFNTRQDFFAEAWRLLRPGGRVVAADLAARTGYESSAWNRLVRQRTRVPEDNVYDAAEYGRRVAAAGFVDVEITSIRQMVYPAMAKLIEVMRSGRVPLAGYAVQVTEAEIARCAGAELWEDDVGLGDFILCSATRPA